MLLQHDLPIEDELIQKCGFVISLPAKDLLSFFPSYCFSH